VIYCNVLGNLYIHAQVSLIKGFSSITYDKCWSISIHKLVTEDREHIRKQELGSS